MTIRIRFISNGVEVSCGMFVSVGAVHVYAQELGIARYEVLQSNKIVFVRS